MSCPVCLRVFALVPLVMIGLSGSVARADSPAPAPLPKTDPAQTPQQPSGNATTQTPAGPPPLPTIPALTLPANPNENTGPPQLLINPAQQHYGLPRNPVVGIPVSVDLSQPLTLNQAIRIALQRQDSIAIAKSQADAADARLVQARSSYYPQITPSLSYVTTLQPGGTVYFNGTPIPGNSQTETRSDLITGQQLIWDTGRREATVGLNRRSAFAAHYTLGDQRQDVILNVVTSYYNVLRDKELVRAEQENLRRAQTTLDSIRAQVQVGNAAQSDALQSEADLANAQITLLQAENSLNTDQATLKNAMGIISNQPLLLAQTQAPVPSTTPDMLTLADYVRTAYANRLDIKAEQERVYAQGYNVRIADINSGLSAQANITEGYALDPNAGEERQFNVSITYPLFDGGNARAVVRENKANLEQERRTLDQLEQTVRLNIEQEYLTRELDRQSIVASQAAVQAGQVNYNAALEKQRNGLINIVDVITAEAQLITAQVSLIQAIYNYYIADAALQRDIGVNDPGYLPKVPGARPPVPPPAATGPTDVPPGAMPRKR
jgi:TolC family type I secretion outer membrane protein